MAETVYDLLVIGAGPGGYRSALYAAQRGLKVAVVDERPLPGGVCLHEGCIPSKALLASSALFAHSIKGLQDHGIDLMPPQLDLTRMMVRKQQIVDRLCNGVKFLFQTHHIDYHHGRATLLPPTLAGHQVEVTTEQRTRMLRAQRLLLATGSQPIDLPALPVDGQRILYANHALALEQVPEHLLIVGAGTISLELGSVWRRLGAAVTVIEAAERIASFAEPALSTALQQALESQGFNFHLQYQVDAVDYDSERLKVRLMDGAGNAQTVTCDRILVAVGRRGNSAGLGLEQIGLSSVDDGMLKVDENFQTAVAGVYALGDLIGGPKSAHRAGRDAQVFVERLLGQPSIVDYTLVPKVIYTSPELAIVGQSAAELEQQGIAYVSCRLPFLINGRAHCCGEPAGYVEMVAAPGSGRLLGVAILGEMAAELINQAAYVLMTGGSAADLARNCPAPPTFGELLTETAQKLQVKIAGALFPIR